MSFSINTNVASLQAMNYLTANSNFQSKTINEVTSGLRIVNSGDDAAGLAVANGYASQEAVLTQGIQNANDGLATLQTIDGGMSNISQLLNRASTLATESASGTFQGSRSVLDNEFQSVMTEINRQAQNIGMNTGGAFNTAMSVFIGGGRDATGNQNDAGAVSEGAVGVNLSAAAVDQQGLGLTSYAATQYADATGGGAATPLTGTPLLNAINAAGSDFTLSFSGAGFSDSTNSIQVTATTGGTETTLAGVVSDINAGITAAIAANPGAANIQAFKTAGIQAQLNSAGTGIEFTSANSPFAVADTGDGTAAAGQAILNTGVAKTEVDAGSQNVALNVGTAMQAGDSQTLTFSAVDSSGNLVQTHVDLSFTNQATTALQVAAINTALQGSAAGSPLKNLVAVEGTAGADAGQINIIGPSSFQVYVGPNTTAADGFQAGATGLSQSTMVTSGTTSTAGALNLTSAANAGLAVTAIGNAVTALGNAQAAVGRGENDLTYATNLAQSQLTNTATSESNIRDADLATEAANLTKAQILMQAGVAALAQANSAPQVILSLLKS